MNKTILIWFLGISFGIGMIGLITSHNEIYKIIGIGMFIFLTNTFFNTCIKEMKKSHSENK